jgi:molecular chaperone DnaK (HSP70)
MRTIQIREAVRNQLTEAIDLRQKISRFIPNRRIIARDSINSTFTGPMDVKKQLANLDLLLNNIKRELFGSERNKELFNNYIQHKAFNKVIVCGGSAEIQKIRVLLREFFAENKITIKPKETVAIGATYKAAILSIESNFNSRIFEKFSKDTLPYSLGIEDYYGDMNVILKKGSEFPIEGKKIFERNLNILDDRRLILKVYEGDDPIATNNHFIGQLEVSNINTPIQIEVSLRVDRCGIVELRVTNISRNDRSQTSIIFNNAEGLFN